MQTQMFDPRDPVEGNLDELFINAEFDAAMNPLNDTLGDDYSQFDAIRQRVPGEVRDAEIDEYLRAIGAIW